ncbi:MAG: GerMN domain-containing protein, partial [Acidobacteria bacterium]|nr:GerMN domain-containing protein [Acidobacteriota bacterium]
MRFTLVLFLALIPVSAPAQTMTLKVYFSNDKPSRSADSCDGKVFPVRRTVPKSTGVARAALEQLFAGPTSGEQARGYSSFFSAQTASILKGVKIENKTAYVNFTDMREMLGNATTSCGRAIFFGQVEATLK